MYRQLRAYLPRRHAWTREVMEYESVGTISREDYLRWAQRSLNRIFKLGLLVDGKVSNAYREAVKRLQMHAGLPRRDGKLQEEEQDAIIKLNHQNPPYVAWAQRALTRADPAIRPSVTGKVDPATRKALLAFQARQNIKPDAWIGSKTELALIQVGRILPPGDTGAVRQFFIEYDLRFLPSDEQLGIPANQAMAKLEKDARTADIEAVLPVLQRRLLERYEAALARKELAAKSLPASVITAARRLSAAQLELYRDFFDDGAGGLRLDEVQNAFVAFANGELREPARGAGAGEPNSPAYFLFAEFALACIESKIDEELWGQLLPTLVKTQELFAQVYHPRATTPDAEGLLARYSWENFDPISQANAARKHWLRNRYDRKSLRELKEAMRNNLRMAHEFNSRIPFGGDKTGRRGGRRPPPRSGR